MQTDVLSSIIVLGHVVDDIVARVPDIHIVKRLLALAIIHNLIGVVSMAAEEKRSTDNKAAENAKISERDMALINVLDRLAAQIAQQDTIIEDMSNKVQELMAAIKDSERKQHLRLDGTEQSVDSLSKDFRRYRADLLKIVNEQDRVSEVTEEISKRQDSIAETQEKEGQILEDLEKRFGIQEKTTGTHYEYSLKQGESLPKQIQDSNRHVSKLHMDTEKRLTEEHRSINKLVKDLRSDAMHRLLALDGIEASLKELLIRTEPPEKKAFFILRFIRFIRLKTSVVFIKLRMRMRAMNDPEAKAKMKSDKMLKKDMTKSYKKELKLQARRELENILLRSQVISQTDSQADSQTDPQTISPEELSDNESTEFQVENEAVIGIEDVTENQITIAAEHKYSSDVITGSSDASLSSDDINVDSADN